MKKAAFRGGFLLVDRFGVSWPCRNGRDVITAIGAGFRVERTVTARAILIPAAAPWLIAGAVDHVAGRRGRVIGWRRRRRGIDRHGLDIGRAWLAEYTAEQGACCQPDYAGGECVIIAPATMMRMRAAPATLRAPAFPVSRPPAVTLPSLTFPAMAAPRICRCGGKWCSNGCERCRCQNSDIQKSIHYLLL